MRLMIKELGLTVLNLKVGANVSSQAKLVNYLN